MPNWCSVDVKIVGEKKSVQKFHNLLNSTLDGKIKPPVKNGFGPGWLGTIVSALGKDYNEIRCRGSFSLLDEDILENKHGLSYFPMFIDHAWAPPYDLFNLISDHYENLNIVYYASEPGCCLYESNDTYQMFFKGKWSIETCNDFDCEEDIYDDKGLIDLVNEIIEGKRATTVDEAIKFAEEYNKEHENNGDDDNYININKINFLWT